MNKNEKIAPPVSGVKLFFLLLAVAGIPGLSRSAHALVPEMVAVKGGCFKMGDFAGQGEPDESPVHEVCLDPFLIGRYEVTQHEWQTIMGNNPSRFKKGDDFPVENVSWDDCQEFIRRLNGLLGGGYRLPTEAEWEFACRSGGKEENYCGGNDLGDLCRYQANSSGSTCQIGTRFPNGLGIYDMSGNVWEWVEDWYGKNYYQRSPKLNPKGPATGFFKVSRGGSWDYGPWFSRSSTRLASWPEGGYLGLGLRLARTPPVVPVGKADK